MYIFMGCWQEISFKISTSIYFLIWFKFYFIVFSYAKRVEGKKGKGEAPHGRGCGRANNDDNGGPGGGPGQGHGHPHMTCDQSLPKPRKTGSATKCKPHQEWNVL